MHKIGRFIVYDAISVITQKVFYVFAGPSELRGAGELPSPIFWQEYKQILLFKKALQGCTKGQKSGGAGSNAARRRCPAAPSDPPKSGGAAAPCTPPSDMPDYM